MKTEKNNDGLKIYLLTRTDYLDWGDCESMVVIAENEIIASKMKPHPIRNTMENSAEWTKSNNVKVKFIGYSDSTKKRRKVILKSYVSNG